MVRHMTPAVVTRNELVLQEGRTYEKDSSILILGLRGSGKSTLAIIASAALSRPVVDTERVFREKTGHSSLEHKKQHGNQAFQAQQVSLLRSIFADYDKNTIIVSSWLDQEAQTLFQGFAKSHIAIHIVRGQQRVAEYLKITDDEKFNALLKYSSVVFRQCCSYEFFNISEDDNLQAAGNSGPSTHKKLSTPYLTLKRVERHFLKFLSIILPHGSVPFSESMSPLVCLPIEQRKFTYVTSIPLSVLIHEGVDVEGLETGADAIEVLVDDWDSTEATPAERDSLISKVVANVRRDIAIPIIYHISLPADCSLEGKQVSQYLRYFKLGQSLAPEYITIDLRLESNLISHLVSTTRASRIMGHVAHGTSPSWSNPIWTEYYQKAQNCGCAMARLTRQTIDVQDNFEIQNFRASILNMDVSKIPLIAFNIGIRGRHSQCYNPIMTSVGPDNISTEPEFDQDSISVGRLPTLTARQATNALFASFLKQPMKLNVFGAKVDDSMSPAMHNAALQACGIPYTYRPYSTTTIQEVRKLAYDPCFAGASVGLPFKVDAISLVSGLSPHAEAIGAINTLIPVREACNDSVTQVQSIIQNCGVPGPVLSLYGENTDWIGIRACLRRGLSPANAVRPLTCGLVIGAGGMARAAVYAMLQLGVKNIVIFNRTKSHAEQMISHFVNLLAGNSIVLSGLDTRNTRFHVIESLEHEWPASDFRLPTLIASCIPTHTIDQAPAPHFTLPHSWMNSPTGGVVIEFAYKYLNTPLLKQVRAETHRGWVAMDGLDLLPEQGFAQFELFTGRRAPRRLMRDEVFRAYPDIHGQSARRQLLPRMEEIVVQEP